jgi:hypothetical protein
MRKIESPDFKNITVDTLIVYYPNMAELPARDIFDRTEQDLMEPYAVLQVLPDEIKMGNTHLWPNGPSVNKQRTVSHDDLLNGKWWLEEEGEELRF